jgi:diaminopimelate epimerase
VRYAKGHGTGNDFVVLPDPQNRLDVDAVLVRALCDRRTGLGGDGALRIAGIAGSPPGGPRWFMDYRNADGSIAEMCGNGIRVVARYLFDHRLEEGPQVAIATRAGTRRVWVEDDDLLTVDMGPATIGCPSWAVIGGDRRAGLAVDVGNPHLACLVDRPVIGFDLSTAPEVDAAVFPSGVNVEVVRVTGRREVEMRVHERGSGASLSCGTGAVAAAVAAAEAAGEWPDGTASQLAGDADRSAKPSAWVVRVPGGTLTVVPDAAASLLTGPAVIVAEGQVSSRWLAGVRKARA